MSTVAGETGWQRFWNRGGFWRAVLLVAVYLVVYVGMGFVFQQVFAGEIDPKNLFATPQSLFFALGAGLTVGAIVVALFVTSVRWWRPLFARQPVRGSWWMWIPVGIILIPALMRIVATDYSSYEPMTVVVMFVFGGLLVGFVEETLTRGIAVKMLRQRGYGERVVAVLAATIFALMHLVNGIGSGIDVTVLTTVVYAFGYGIFMYLVMRVTGNLIWAILLHAITDPTLALAAGGIDNGATAGAPVNPLLSIAALENPLIIALGIIAVIFITGRATATRGAHATATVSD